MGGRSVSNVEIDWYYAFLGIANMFLSFVLSFVSLVRWMHIDDVGTAKGLNTGINGDVYDEDKVLAGALADDMYFSSKIGMDYVNKYAIVEVALFTATAFAGLLMIQQRIWYFAFLVLVPGMMIYWRRFALNQHVINDKNQLNRKNERKRYEHDSVFAMFASFVILFMSVFM